VVGRPVVADESGAVHGEHDVQALQRDVVDDLVVGALEEGRVDRRDGLEALERQPGGEEDRLLLGDPDVEVVRGLGLLQDVQARPGVHRGRDADDPPVAADLLDHRVAEDLRVLRRGGAADARLGAFGRLDHGRAVGDGLGLGGVPLLHALQPAVLGGAEALALHRGDVDDHGPAGAEGARPAPCAAPARRGRPPRRRTPSRAPPTTGRGPEGLEGLLELRAEPLDRRAEAAGQLGELVLDLLAACQSLGCRRTRWK
jgi:hypothetical protein